MLFASICDLAAASRHSPHARSNLRLTMNRFVNAAVASSTAINDDHGKIRSMSERNCAAVSSWRTSQTQSVCCFIEDLECI
jgi:hypothetical protein